MVIIMRGNSVAVGRTGRGGINGVMVISILDNGGMGR